MLSASRVSLTPLSQIPDEEPMPTLARLSLPAFILLAPSLALALESTDVSIQMTTSPRAIVDSNNACIEGPNAMYVGIAVTNATSSVLPNLTATLDGLVSGFLLAGGQSAAQQLGRPSAGETRYAYWYVEYPCTAAFTSPPTFHITDGNPGDAVFSSVLTVDDMISANAGGIVESMSVGAGAVVGQHITLDVVHSFGGLSAGDNVMFNPAGNLDFNAGCLQLFDVEVMASALAAVPVGARQSMYFTSPVNAPGSGQTVSVRYQFRYRCANFSTTALPFAATGNSFVGRYTGNYGTCEDAGGCDQTFPTSANPLTITKTASACSPSGSGTTLITVTIANNDNFPSRVESISDVIPSGATYITHHATSDVTATNSASSPLGGSSGPVTWLADPPSLYEVPASGSIRLVYEIAEATLTADHAATARMGDVSFGPAVAGCADTDGDGLLDTDEVLFGSGIRDADSDDDGLLDGDEMDPTANPDTDTFTNILDPDADGDGLPDGLEMGRDCASPSSNPDVCRADGDLGGTTTNPVIADSDNGGAADGAEDKNGNGVVDPGERDPRDPTDDTYACLLDSQCGEPASAQICGTGMCVPGCRGANGNGCPVDQVCTSTDGTPGACVTVDAGVPSMDAGVPDATVPDAAEPAPDAAVTPDAAVSDAAAPAPDAAMTPDAAAPDAAEAVVDAGPVVVDAGPTADAARPDASTTDAAVGDVDAGSPDAGNDDGSAGCDCDSAGGGGAALPMALLALVTAFRRRRR